MTRIILLAVVIALIANFIRVAIKAKKYKTCVTCEGKGFWHETRGEKSYCKICDGRGYLEKENLKSSL